MNVLTQAQLNDWLDALAQKRTLVAPVNIEGKLLYRPVDGSQGIAWGFERTEMSPKTWLLPATEPILSVRQGEKTEIRALPVPEPKVVFGVRPCDARGALAIDALFLNKDPIDGQYARHREATTLIGLACPRCGRAAFAPWWAERRMAQRGWTSC